MTKSEKIKAEIERRMKYFQKEKDALPITTETRTDVSIYMCVCMYTNDDQQLYLRRV